MRKIWRAFRNDRGRIMGIMLALFAFGVAILSSDHFAARRAAEAEHIRLSTVARLTAASYQRQVDKFRLVATTLSSDSDVSDLLDKRTPRAALSLNERLANLSTALDASVIYLLDQKGTTIASSNWRQADSFLGETYQFRAYFREAMARGEWEQYALGTRSRIPGLFVARRVITGARSIGVIVVKIRFDRLEREWAASVGSAFVTNKQGVILVSSKPEWRFQTTRKLSDEEQQRLRSQVEFGSKPLLHNRLFARKAVILRASEFSNDAAFIAGQERLQNGLSLYVLAPLEASISAARSFGRLVVLVIGVLIAAISILSIFRRRAIIAAEQRVAAERITDLKDRLIQANKLSSLGQMAAGIGHEINQPLTAIGIRAKNALKLIDSGRASEAADILGEISMLTTRMGAITGELRRFAKRAEPSVGIVSLQNVLRGTQLLLSDLIRTSGTTLTFDPADISIIGEQIRLEQVFVNLIQNAIDAMGDGGEIDIAYEIRDGILAISVGDSGPGISEDIRERLFQPFRTSKDDGVGLGLVICRDIISDFGGELNWVPSRSGALFIMKLRIAR